MHSDKPDPNPSDTHDTDAPRNPQRRRLLGGVTAGAALVAAGCRMQPAGANARTRPAPTGADLDALLQKHIGNVVVIYAENRSFNNLFADFPGLQKPLSALDPKKARQRDRDGSLLQTLPKIWRGMVPHKQVVEHRPFKIGEDAITGLANAPFALQTPEGDPLPHGVVTRDLVHAFYRNQKQINGGANDGFVAWGDSGALVMGHYADTDVNLRLHRIAREYTLCDNFFMGAFGGSFLNHQYLVAAQPPTYPNADHSPAHDRIAVLNGADPAGTDPKLAPDSPASAMDGVAKFASHTTLTPDFRAVNTMAPPYAPTFTPDPDRPLYADPESAWTLPPQSHPTIGDALSDGGVDWAWYAGGFDAALAGDGEGKPGQFPHRPNFQPHHQPFNYYQRFAPGTAARKKHLRDAGVGSTARTNHFLADAAAGKLPPVAYYKPQGNLNMHAGYSDVDAGDRHMAEVLEQLKRSPQWANMLVVVTFDENGGWWDHVAPPKADRWGPGTRIPALVVSRFAKKSHVDHTVYDTGSIARFLTRRFGLRKLDALRQREDAMRKASGFAPGDLTATLDFSDG